MLSPSLPERTLWSNCLLPKDCRSERKHTLASAVDQLIKGCWTVCKYSRWDLFFASSACLSTGLTDVVASSTCFYCSLDSERKLAWKYSRDRGSIASGSLAQLPTNVLVSGVLCIPKRRLREHCRHMHGILGPPVCWHMPRVAHLQAQLQILAKSQNRRGANEEG